MKEIKTISDFLKEAELICDSFTTCSDGCPLDDIITGQCPLSITRQTIEKIIEHKDKKEITNKEKFNEVFSFNPEEFFGKTLDGWLWLNEVYNEKK